MDGYTPKSVGFGDVHHLSRNFTFGDTPPPSPGSALKRRSIAESTHSNPSNNRPSVSSPYWKGKRSSSVAMAALTTAVPFTATIRNLSELKTQEITAATIAAFYDDVAGALLHDDEVTGLPVEYPNRIYHIMKSAAGLDDIVHPDISTLVAMDSTNKIFKSQDTFQSTATASTTSFQLNIDKLSSPISADLAPETPTNQAANASPREPNYFEQLQLDRVEQKRHDAEEEQKNNIKKQKQQHQNMLKSGTITTAAQSIVTDGPTYRLETDEERLSRMSKRDKSELKRKIFAGKRVLDPSAIFTNVDKSHPVLSRIQPLEANTNFPVSVVDAHENLRNQQVNVVESVLRQVVVEEVDTVMADLMQEREAINRLKMTVAKRKDIEEAAEKYAATARSAASFSMQVHDRSFGSFSSFKYPTTHHHRQSNDISFMKPSRSNIQEKNNGEPVSAFHLISKKPAQKRSSSVFASSRDVYVRKQLVINEDTGRVEYNKVPDGESETDEEIVHELETERYLTDPMKSAVFQNVQSSVGMDAIAQIPTAEIERRQRKVRHWKRRLARDAQLSHDYFSSENERKRRLFLASQITRQVHDNVTRDLVVGNCDGLFQVEQSQQEMERLRNCIKLRDELANAHRTELLKEICQVQESLRSTVGKYTELRAAHEDLSVRFQQAKRLVLSIGVGNETNTGKQTNPSFQAFSSEVGSIDNNNNGGYNRGGSFMLANRPSFHDFQQIFGPQAGGGLTRKRSVFNFNVSQTDKSLVGPTPPSRLKRANINSSLKDSKDTNYNEGVTIPVGKANSKTSPSKIDSLAASGGRGGSTAAPRTRSQSPANLELEALTAAANTNPYHGMNDMPAITSPVSVTHQHSTSAAPTPTSEVLSTSPSVTNVSSVAHNNHNFTSGNDNRGTANGGSYYGVLQPSSGHSQRAPSTVIVSASPSPLGVGGSSTTVNDKVSISNGTAPPPVTPASVLTAAPSYSTQLEPVNEAMSDKITSDTAMNSIPIIILPTLMSKQQHQEQLEREWTAIDAKHEEALKVIKQAQEAQRKARLLKSEASRYQEIQQKRGREAHEDALSTLASQMQQQIDQWQKRVKVVRGKATHQIEKLKSESKKEAQKTTLLAKERASRSLGEWNRKLECKEMELCDQQRHFEYILENLTQKEAATIQRFEDQIKHIQEGHRIVKDSDNKSIATLQLKLKAYIDREREQEEKAAGNATIAMLIPSPPTLSTINLNEIAEVQITRTPLKRVSSTLSPRKSNVNSDPTNPRVSILDRKSSTVSSTRSIKAKTDTPSANLSIEPQKPSMRKPIRQQNKLVVSSPNTSRHPSSLRATSIGNDLDDVKIDHNAKSSMFISADDFGSRATEHSILRGNSPIDSIARKTEPSYASGDPLGGTVHAHSPLPTAESATQTIDLIMDGSVMTSDPMLLSHTVPAQVSSLQSNGEPASGAEIPFNMPHSPTSWASKMALEYQHSVMKHQNELLLIRDSILQELLEGLGEGLNVQQGGDSDHERKGRMVKSLSKSSSMHSGEGVAGRIRSPSPSSRHYSSSHHTPNNSVHPTVGHAPHLRTADRVWQRDHHEHISDNGELVYRDGFQSHTSDNDGSPSNGPHTNRQQRQRDQFIIEERLRWEKVCRMAIDEVGAPPSVPISIITPPYSDHNVPVAPPRRPQSAAVSRNARGVL